MKTKMKKVEVKKRLNEIELREKMQYLITFSLGCSRLGIDNSVWHIELQKFCMDLRKLGFNERKINYLISRAQNNYKLYVECYRVQRRFAM